MDNGLTDYIITHEASGDLKLAFFSLKKQTDKYNNKNNNVFRILC